MPTGLSAQLKDPVRLAQLFAPAGLEPAVGLAVSGGPDSLALMVLARRWIETLDHKPRIIVYSLDHGLRPEAAAEVAMVLDTAAQCGFASRGLKWLGDKPATGVQEAARQARYRLIGEAMRADGATLLLTAHHLSDQAETVLMRLGHGSGVDGLKGMAALSEVEGVKIFRPLLGIEPDVLAAAVAEAGLVAVHDPSNDDPDYERVRWRKLLPTLAAEGLDGATLARFARRMADADAALAQMAEIAFGELVSFDGFGTASISVERLRALSPEIARRVLARVLAIAGGQQKPRALGQIERLYAQLVEASPPFAITLLGAMLRWRGDRLTVSREAGRALPAQSPLPTRGGLVWDRRFLISNSSDDTSLVAAPAGAMPRQNVEKLLGEKITAPMNAVHTAPVVRDAAGTVLALGRWSFDARISIEPIAG